MPATTCPAIAELKRLFESDLSDKEIAELEQHVSTCPACLANLKKVMPPHKALADAFSATDMLDADAKHPLVVNLIRRLETSKPDRSKVAKPASIAFACASCGKKLSTKPELAGRKVKCPGCGTPTLVPRQASAGEQTLASAAPVSRSSEQPTDPPLSRPDTTQGAPRPDSNLIDFLAKPQSADELGRLGKYRVLKILGHGGMGVVFMAEDPKLKRRVALKAMLPSLGASVSARKRFEREAQSLAAVEHDHIARIYDVGEENNVSYLAMEFLKGEPLDVKMNREGKLPAADVIRIGREAAEGLAAAHAIGMVHRDIKPGNLWIEAPKNRVKILDFGLARASDDAHLTQSGAIIGTPAYMAPEQGRGEKVDARGDLFSLGVVLYRIATGKSPFTGKDTVSMLVAVAMENPAEPKAISPDVPAVLSDLIMNLLEKDPADRPQSAQELADTLVGMQTQMPTARPPAKSPAQPAAKKSPPAPAIQPKKPRRWPFIAVGVLAAAVLLAVAGVVFFMETPHGIVRIEIMDPAIQVALDNDGFKVQGAYKEPFTVSPGDHTLHIKKGDFDFDTTNFVVKKGAVTTLKIDWLDGKVKVERGGNTALLPAKNPANAEWTRLFNGKDLTGWKTADDSPGNWKVENGVLVASSFKDKPSHLFTELADFDDFHARIKAKINAEGNSGFYFRVPAIADGFPKGYEAQIYLGDAKYVTGSVYDFCDAVKRPTLDADSWFTMEVIARGNHVVVKVNGETTADFIDSARTYAKGHLAIQCSSAATAIQIASVEVKRLTSPSPTNGAPWTPSASGRSPLDKLDPSEIPPEETFAYQPKELVAVIGSHARGSWLTGETVTFSPDGKLAASGGNGSLEVTVWDVTTGKRKWSFQAASNSPMQAELVVRKIRFSPDSKRLFVGVRIAPFNNDAVRIFDISGDQPAPENFSIRAPMGFFNLLSDGPGNPVIETGGGRPGETAHTFHIVKANGVEKVGEEWKPPLRGWPRNAEATSEIFYISDANKLMRVRVREGKPGPAEAVNVPLKDTTQLVTVSSNGKRIVLEHSGDNQTAVGPVEIWDLAASPPKLIGTPTLRFDGDWIRFSPDGRWMSAQYSGTGVARIDGKEIKFIFGIRTGPGACTDGVAFSADSKKAAFVTQTGFVKFYQLEGDDPEKAEGRELFPLDFSTAFWPPDDRSLSFNSAKGSLLIPRYDGQNPANIWSGSRYQLWSLSGKRPTPVGGPNRFLDVDGWVAPAPTAESDDRWFVRDSEQRAGFSRLGDEGWEPVTDRFLDPHLYNFSSPDGALVVSKGEKEGELVGYDTRVSPPELLWTIPMGAHAIEKNPRHLRNIWISKDKKTFVTFSQADGQRQVVVWDNSGWSDKSGIKSTTKPVLRHTIPVDQTYRAALSPDGKYLVHTRTGEDGVTILIDDITGAKPREVARTQVDNGRITSLNFHPDSKQFLWTGYAGLGVYNIATQKHVWSWRKNPGPVSSAEFADDGRHIVSYNANSTVYVLRVPELIGRPAAKETPPPVVNVKRVPWQPPVVSPLDNLDPNEIPQEEKFDGQPKGLVGVVGKSAGRMWIVGGGTVTFSPDGTLAATGGGGSLEVVVWDVAAGKRKWSFPGTSYSPLPFDVGIVKVRFSPDGKRLLVGAQPFGGVRIFDISDKRPELKLPDARATTNFDLLTGSPGEATIHTWSREAESTTHLFYRLKDDNVEPVDELKLHHKSWPLVAEAAGEIYYRSDDNKVMRVRVRAGKPAPAEVVDVPLPKGGFVVSVSSDGKRIALPDNKSEERFGPVDIWDISVSPAKRVGTLPEMDRGYNRVRFSPDGRWVSSLDRWTYLYHIDGDQLQKVAQEWAETVGDTGAFTADSKKFMLMSGRGWVRFYALDAGDAGKPQIKVLNPPWDDDAMFLKPLTSSEPLDSAAGQILLPRFGGPRHQLWSLSGKRPTPMGGKDAIVDVERWFTPAPGNRWIVADWNSPAKFMHLAPTGWRSVGDPVGPAKSIRAASADGALFVSVGQNDGELVGYDTTVTPPEVAWTISMGEHAIDKNTPYWRSILISKDKRTILTYSPSPDKEKAPPAAKFRIAVWDNSGWGVPGARPMLRQIVPVADAPDELGGGAAALSPDGKYLAHTRLADGGNVIVIDDITGPKPREVVRTRIDDSRISSLSFHPDSNQFLWTGIAGIGVYNIAAQKHTWSWRTNPGIVFAAEFADDGRHIVSYNGNSTIYIIRVPELAPLPKAPANPPPKIDTSVWKAPPPGASPLDNLHS